MTNSSELRDEIESSAEFRKKKQLEDERKRLEEQVQNNICGEILFEKLNNEGFWRTAFLNLTDTVSSNCNKRTKYAIVNYVKYFYCYEADQLINVENCIILPGLSTALDLLFSCICDDPEDIVLSTAPFDVHLQAKLYGIPRPFSIVGIPFDDLRKPFLSVQSFKDALETIKGNGKNVIAIYLQNPSNPLGVCFELCEFAALCEWAMENDLFVIVDESLAHTADWPINHKNESIFTSLLQKLRIQNNASLEGKNCWSFETILSAADRLVWIWSADEDFCLPGTQLTAIFTENKDFKEKLAKYEEQQLCSALTQFFVEKILEDLEWVAHFQITKYNQLLEGRKSALAWLCDTSLLLPGGVLTASSNPTAGTSILISLRPFLPIDNFEGEQELRRLIAAKTGIFMESGSQMGYYQEPGWYKFVVSRKKRVLDNALRHLTLALKENKRLDDTEWKRARMSEEHRIGSFESNSTEGHNEDLKIEDAVANEQIQPNTSDFVNNDLSVTYINLKNDNDEDYSVDQDRHLHMMETEESHGNRLWEIDYFDASKYGGCSPLFDTNLNPATTKNEKIDDTLTKEKKQSDRSVHWVDQHSSNPPSLPFTIDIPIKIIKDDQGASQNWIQDKGTLVDESLTKFMSQNSPRSIAEEKERVICSRSDSGLAELADSASPERTFPQPIQTKTCHSKDNYQKMSNDSIFSESTSTEIDDLEIGRRRHILSPEGPTAQYLSDSGVFVELQPGVLTIDFPIRVNSAEIEPVNLPEEEEFVEIQNNEKTNQGIYLPKTEGNIATKQADQVLTNNFYSIEVDSNQTFAQPQNSELVEIDLIFKDIRVEKNVFAFTEVSVNEPTFLTCKLNVQVPKRDTANEVEVNDSFITIIDDYNAKIAKQNKGKRSEELAESQMPYEQTNGFRETTMSHIQDSSSTILPSESKTNPHQVHHEISVEHQQQQPNSEKDSNVVIKHVNITEIEYCGGIGTYSEDKQEISTRTSVGLNRSAPDEYFTRIYLNGRLNGTENVHRRDRTKKYIEHRTIKSYREIPGQISDGDPIRTTKTAKRIDTNYVVLRQLDNEKSLKINGYCQSDPATEGKESDNETTLGDNNSDGFFVDRGTQTSDAVANLCSRLRLVSTKTPISDAEEGTSREPANYEYLVCRNRAHVGQNDHCNPERLYTLRHQQIRGKHSPHSPPPTPTNSTNKRESDLNYAEVMHRLSPRDHIGESSENLKDFLNPPSELSVTTQTRKDQGTCTIGIPYDRVEVRHTPGSNWIVSSVAKTVATENTCIDNY